MGLNKLRSVLPLFLLAALCCADAYPQSSLWTPVAVEKRNLFYGAGGPGMLPATSRIKFLGKDSGGNNLKYRISDARGRLWVAKIADESRPEVAANRLLWAIGYHTEIDYLVPKLAIPGKKVYQNVRLEARPKGFERGDSWKWDQNPFMGTREFNGLRIMMAFINNWDLKDDNNKIIVSGGQRRYIVSDLGSSFGKLPVASSFILNRIDRTVGEPGDFLNSTFIHGFNDDGTVDFAYKGKAKDLLKGLTATDVRWIYNLLSRLSDRQIRDAFRAANYSRSETALYSRAVRNRINDLRNLVNRSRVADAGRQ